MRCPYARGRRTVVADIAILATGNDGRPVLDGIPAVQPWAEDALHNLSADLPVLLIGTGLTMVDMALSLDRLGHRGKITALSARGLLSQVHRPVQPVVVPAPDIPIGTELSELISWVRKLCTSVTDQGGDWRSVIDALRPHTQRIWRAMSVLQKQRFVRHARAHWDVHRHRLAPEVQTQLSGLRAAGRLEIVAGRIADAEKGTVPSPSKWFAAVKARAKLAILHEWSIAPDRYMIPVNRPIR